MPQHHQQPAAVAAEAGAPRWAADPAFGWLVLATGAVSFVASWILVLERIALYLDPGHTTSCDLSPWVSCGTVMRSWQAGVFGFPNPLVGIVGFAVVVAIGVSLAAGARFPRWYWWGFQAGITFAFGFVVWLWSQAVYDIFALCLYCMVVWAMVIPLFVYTTARNIVRGVVPAPPALRRLAAEWAWVVAALLLVLCAGSVFLRFIGVFLGG